MSMTKSQPAGNIIADLVEDFASIDPEYTRDRQELEKGIAAAKRQDDPITKEEEQKRRNALDIHYIRRLVGRLSLDLEPITPPGTAHLLERLFDGLLELDLDGQSDLMLNLPKRAGKANLAHLGQGKLAFALDFLIAANIGPKKVAMQLLDEELKLADIRDEANTLVTAKRVETFRYNLKRDKGGSVGGRIAYNHMDNTHRAYSGPQPLEQAREYVRLLLLDAKQHPIPKERQRS